MLFIIFLSGICLFEVEAQTHSSTGLRQVYAESHANGQQKSHTEATSLPPGRGVAERNEKSANCPLRRLRVYIRNSVDTESGSCPKQGSFSVLHHGMNDPYFQRLRWGDLTDQRTDQQSGVQAYTSESVPAVGQGITDEIVKILALGGMDWEPAEDMTHQVLQTKMFCMGEIKIESKELLCLSGKQMHTLAMHFTKQFRDQRLVCSEAVVTKSADDQFPALRICLFNEHEKRCRCPVNEENGNDSY